MVQNRPKLSFLKTVFCVLSIGWLNDFSMGIVCSWRMYTKINPESILMVKIFRIILEIKLDHYKISLLIKY